MRAWAGPQARRGVVLFALDAAAAGLAVWAAFWLRFDGQLPAPYEAALPRAVLVAVASGVVCSRAAGLHRWSFRLAGLSDALRVCIAGLAGTAGFVALWALLIAPGIPRSVVILEFFLATSLSGVARFGPRVGLRWVRLARSGDGLTRTLIIGAGSEGELLARDLQRSRESRHRLVGFVSANGETAGTRLDGVRVLGAISDLPRLIERHAVTTVLLAEPCRSPARIREIVDTCASSRVSFKVMPAAARRPDRLSVAMLDDLSPADLLPRDSVAFDEAATRALVRDRRALVTGAGGSIGSELCRQLARFGARQLVMVDMNENELYLGRRRLAAEYPELDIRVEVADIREADSLRRMGERHHPQDVFHAAAHKHVPLMEDAPDEAVKNNVFGTLNVAHMAHLCGAERFVLISTDKAVKPSSVMGATKRVAELVIRDLGRSSRTKMTAVRFGNVLGSAGSVLPIFREQIARGGPVTVTHPECTRYFMTISEAVGLTLLAGLGGYGDLCVLDMGEPIRIADLARFMVALAGRAGEIDVVYTGLRPGEKVSEELLTEDEERSQVVRDRIRVTSSPPPPPDLARRLSELRVLAQAGDRGGVLSLLRALVPTYEVPRNVVDVERTRLATPERAAAPAAAPRPAFPSGAELALE